MNFGSDNARVVVCLVGAVVLHALMTPLAAKMLGSREMLSGVLRVEGMAVAEELDAGAVVSVVMTVGNLGETATEGPWTDRVVLSRDRVVDGGDVVLLERVREGGLSVDARYDVEGEMVVPADADGPMFVIGVTGQDSAEGVVLRGELTGWRRVWVNSQKGASVVVDAIDVQEVVQAGGFAQVEVTVVNDGEGYAKPGWTDRLWWSRDMDLGADDLALEERKRALPLGPGEAYRLRYEVGIPMDAAGRRWLIAGTRGGERLLRAVDVRAMTTPDLVVLSAEVPRQIVAGQSTDVKFRVGNFGSVGTGIDVWTDAVFLSLDDVLDDEDELLSGVFNPLPLEPGEQYRSEGHLVTLPDPLQSRAYLIFVTDAEGVVDEDVFEDNNVLVVPFDWLEPLAEDATLLGRDEPSPPLSMAWISHDDFQALQAPESVTEQPAVQTKMDPVADAPPILDPAPPTVEAKRPADPTAPVVVEREPVEATEVTPVLEAEPVEEVSEPTVDAQVAAKVEGGMPSIATAKTGDVPVPVDMPETTNPNPSDGTVAKEAGDSAEGAEEPTEGKNPEPSPSKEVAENDAVQPSEADEPTPPTVATEAPREGGTPTSAARSDREAPPVQLRPDAVKVQVGKVVTVEGIEIKTSAPNFSAVTRASAIPTSPKAMVTFDKDGVVIDVKIIRSSGSDNVDGPIVSSLYRWKASGKKLEQLGRSFKQEFTIILE